MNPNPIVFFSIFFCLQINSEALHAWRTKARCNIVPAERLHELFEELEFNPTEKQSKNFSQWQAFELKGFQIQENVAVKYKLLK